MPRKYKSTEHLLMPDHKYNSKLAGKFINCIMRRGKKSLAEKIFYSSLAVVEKKITDQDPFKVFTQAIENVKPIMEVRSRRVGGATYQVPVRVNPKRQLSLAIRWIIQAAKKKKGRPMYLKLADELIAAFKKEGEAMTIRENVHRMAEANKAFAHFAW